MKMKPLMIAISSLLLVMIVSTPGVAAIIPITSPTLTAPVDNQVGMTAFEVAGSEYSILSIGSVISGVDTTGADYWFGGGASESTVGRAASELDAMNDALITTGGFGSNFNGGGASGILNVDTITVNTGDAAVFYITEHSTNVDGPGNDAGIIVRPLDGSGAVIPGWQLVLNGASWGKLVDMSWNGNAHSIVGLTFTIDDFDGVGVLSSVSGLQIVTDQRLDPGQVGVALIPEPASLALLGLGGVVMMSRRRRGRAWTG